MTLDPWDLIGTMADLLKQTAQERNAARSEIERLNTELVVAHEGKRAATALVEALHTRAGSDPVAGEGAGEAGGGGGSEPPPSPPTLGTSDGLPESWKWENVTSVPGPLLLAGMVAPLITESPLMDGDVEVPPGVGEPLGFVDEPVPGGLLDSQGLPAGYRCDLCSRVLATQAGKARHMTVAHQAKALTREQVERQTELASGDPGGYVKRDPEDEPIGADGLVGCGIGDCTARRSATTIERHRLSMHGQ